MRVSVSKVKSALARFQANTQTLAAALGKGTLRDRALAVADAIDSARAVGASLVAGQSGRDRLRSYFLQNVGEVLSSRELMAVSGIQEFARRIRELRVEEGYRILTGVTVQAQIEEEAAEGVSNTVLRPDEYLLSDPVPDANAAEKWQIANDIRKTKWPVKRKVLELLKANVGHPVSGEELIYVSGGKTEWARRARELRTEEGWLVATHYTGRPDLAPSLYVLETLERAPKHDRKIDDQTRRYTLQRDKYTCQECGWKHSDWNRDDPRRLELHHIKHHVARGSNEANNLKTLCNVCHDKYHSKSERH